MENRLFFWASNFNPTGYAYGFDGAAQTSENKSTTGFVFAAASNSTRYILSSLGGALRYFDFDDNEQTDENWTLSFFPEAIIATDDRLIAIDASTAHFFTHDGTEQTNENISHGLSTPRGATLTPDHYVISDLNENVKYFSRTDRSEQTALAHTLPSGDYRAAVATDDTIHFINSDGGETVAYDFSAVRQSGRNITGLASRITFTGAFATFAPSFTGATLTITADAPIYAGQLADLAITADQDVTDLAIGDITLTDATAISLTRNAADDYTLRIRAAANAGDIVVTIAENAVAETNLETIQTFTRTANPTVAISFDANELARSGATTVTYEWSVAPTGFTAADTDASDGTLSDFSGSATTFTQTLTAPATGEGRLTVSVSANSIEQGNAATSADINYGDLLVIGWQVPDRDENNDFPLILTSNRELTGVELGDFVLRRADGVFTNLNASNTAISQVPNTHNWRLDISLTGTFDHDFQIRLRRNRIQENGMDVPSSNLNSPNFHIDSSITTPAAPTQLTVDTVTQTSITFSFTAGADGGLSITTFEYELDGDGNWESFESTDTEQTIDELTHSTEVDIKVRGVNPEGAGTASAALTATTASPPLVLSRPEAPTISVESVDYRAIVISIIAGHDGNTAITDWEYELDGDGTWHSFGRTDTEQTIPDLTPDTAYAIKVRGVNSEGSGTASDTVRGRTAALTDPDPATHLRRVSATTTQIVIAWRAPENNGGAELTSYKINVDGTVTDTGSTDTSATLSGLSPSETVEISVAAVNPEGTGAYSDSIEVTTDAEFTITTTERDIRELQRFDINIAATGAVSGLTRAKVPVTGATVNSFTANASDDYTLNVTADTGEGNIVLSINEDVVLPGNAPVSKSFRRSAYPIPEITFGVRQVNPGDDLPVNIDWDESVDGFDDADITVIGTGATKGVLEGSGRAYRLTIQTTPTGTGRITVRIRPNAVTEGNRQKQASISYVMPPVWQTGSALESRIDALGDTRIDITQKVENATEIQALGGLQEWLSFDGTHLVIEQAPILRKATEFRVKLRASNAEDVHADAFYILTVNASKLVMLQSTLFFKPSITYESDRVKVHGTNIIVREMTDNNYETFSSENDVEINTANADGNHPTTIHFIALKTKKVERFSFFPSGGSGTGFMNREMPTRFVATGGEDIPTVVNGFQHELYPLPEPVTATEVRLQFHGTDIEIYAVMLLELIAEIRDGEFLDILPDKVDRTGEIIEFPDGGVDRGDVIGAERWKWETEYVLQVLPSVTSFDTVPAVRKFISDHPHIVHAEEPARHPERIYPAVQASFEITDELQSKRGYQTSGSIVPFTVAEA